MAVCPNPCRPRSAIWWSGQITPPRVSCMWGGRPGWHLLEPAVHTATSGTHPTDPPNPGFLASPQEREAREGFPGLPPQGSCSWAWAGGEQVLMGGRGGGREAHRDTGPPRSLRWLPRARQWPELGAVSRWGWPEGPRAARLALLGFPSRKQVALCLLTRAGRWAAHMNY